MHLDMMADMDHGGHGGHGGMMMDMDGHFGQLETDARIVLGELVRGNHSWSRLRVLSKIRQP